MALDLLLEQFDGLIQTPADIKKLEQTILQWGVMGRLVPQDPNDEPASVLLKRIAAEKARLVKEKKIKRPKKLPPISPEEIPTELPKEWSVCRLGEITMKLGAGSTPKGGKKVYTETGVKFLRSQNIWNHGLRLDRVAYIPDEINQRMFKTIVRPKDVLLNITGASIGRSALVPDDFDLGNVSQHVAIVRPIEPETRFFIHLCLISPYIQRKIMDVQVGISREGLSMTQLKKFVFPMPPLEEQKRIIARVDELFEQTRGLAAQLEAAQEARTRLHRAAVGQFVSAITKSPALEPPLAPLNAPSQDMRPLFMAEFDRLHTQQADVDALKQTILQLGVMGRLVPQDPNDEPASVLLKRIAAEKARLVKEKKIKRGKKLAPISSEEMPRIPQNWKWTYLNNLIVGIKAGKSPQAQKRPAENGEVGVLKVSAVTWGTFNPIENKALLPGTDVTNWPTVQASDFLISRANTAKLVGAVVLVEEDYPNLVLSDKTLRLDFVHDSIFKQFMLFALRARWVRDMFEAGAIGTSSSMRNISQSKIRAAKIALPPLEEQKRIVARVDELFALCDQLAAELKSAEAMRERFLGAVLAQAARG
ncbi:MAG: restriction endonuclease subunit S [Ardenticatenaceae bacterium]